MAGAAFNTGKSNQSVSTPGDFMAAFHKRFFFPRINLAAEAHNTKADVFLSEADDALTYDWRQLPGPRWLNPPFKNLAPWVEKASELALTWPYSSVPSELAVLVPASVGSNWFRDHVDGKAYVVFLNGRLTFESHKDPYPKDMMLCMYGCIPGYEVWDWRGRRRG